MKAGWDRTACEVAREDWVAALGRCMETSSPKMTGGTREAPVNSSPAVAANAEGEEIEVLESTDVFPVGPEEVSLHTTSG